MVDLVFALAVGLLAAGVVGSIVPGVPGALLSLTGVGVHWWATDYAEPGPLALVGLVLLGVTALLVDLLAAPLAARAGGASLRTTALATVVGLVGVVVVGPVGALVGVVTTVFLLEARETDTETSLRAALVTALGILASSTLQVLLTGTMLVGFLFAIYAP